MTSDESNETESVDLRATIPSTRDLLEAAWDKAEEDRLNKLSLIRRRRRRVIALLDGFLGVWCVAGVAAAIYRFADQPSRTTGGWVILVIFCSAYWALHCYDVYGPWPANKLYKPDRDPK